MISKKIDKILKFISAIISIALIIFGIVMFKRYLIKFTYLPGVFISFLILILMLVKILYLYLYNFLKLIINKKIVKGILLLIPVIVMPVILIYIKYNVHYLLRNSVILICYIVATVCLPIIILGINILNDIKYKKMKIIISVILMIYIYVLNSNLLVVYAKVVVQNLSGNTIENLLEKEKSELDLSYLNSYTQKMARNGYLDKFDVTKILSIVDSKSAKIFINYKDSLSNIDLKITNKEDEKIATLKNSLEAEYYKFNYEVNENNEITVNIERYVIENNINTVEEKNSEIILTGNKNLNIIENINKNFTDEKDVNYNFENKINIANNLTGKEIYSLKLLFVYDKETNNYVPVDEQSTNYSLIKSYKVNSNKIQIILNDGAILEKQDYTLRLNRYDDNLSIPKEKNTNYYYKYEPVVDTYLNSTNNIILEIEFDNMYRIKDLKNIEIIF